MTDYEFDALSNAAQVAHMNVEVVETVKTVNDVNYVKREFLLDGEEYKAPHFECNCTIKHTEEEILAWIDEVFFA
ncbi:hypothetical protein VPFG_00230 [Vibrio phage nt-1]|uniref:Phage protein n=1 Tax=Vibrio phage nt-1 TaxID=115992 RepID=R9TFH6_9CAUD|nr:hypothetical protein VPFG_00230 [Vibrio phage nt-1]AGN30229.1 hypothetical protein VPFG_00230 [Vibrio phage nt-1]